MLTEWKQCPMVVQQILKKSNTRRAGLIIAHLHHSDPDQSVKGICIYEHILSTQVRRYYSNHQYTVKCINTNTANTTTSVSIPFMWTCDCNLYLCVECFVVGYFWMPLTGNTKSNTNHIHQREIITDRHWPLCSSRLHSPAWCRLYE